MGYVLYREIRDNAPAGWTPAERLVALMIADDANDTTRKSWIKLPDLMQRAGIKSESGIRQALQRLAARGYEFRVPIGKGKDGRLVFAAKGHSLDFIVPPMPERRLATVAFKGDSPQSPNDPKATVTDAKGDSPQSPLSSAPLLKDQKMVSPPRSASGRARRETMVATRQAHASGASARIISSQDKIDGTRFAIAEVYGESWNKTISDEEVLDLFELKAPKNGRKVTSVTAYMRKIFGDTPAFDTLLSQLDDDGSDDYDLAEDEARAQRERIINGERCARCDGTRYAIGANQICAGCESEIWSQRAEPEGWNVSILQAVRTALFITAGKTVDDAWCARVADYILTDDKGKPRDIKGGVAAKVKYITTTISNDGNPARFLPTPTP